MEKSRWIFAWPSSIDHAILDMAGKMFGGLERSGFLVPRKFIANNRNLPLYCTSTGRGHSFVPRMSNALIVVALIVSQEEQEADCPWPPTALLQCGTCPLSARWTIDSARIAKGSISRTGIVTWVFWYHTPCTSSTTQPSTNMQVVAKTRVFSVFLP